MSSTNSQIIKTLKPKDIFKLIKKERKDNFIILDVRTPWEFATEHIECAKNLDFTEPDFEKKLSELDKKKTSFIYCKSGIRSDTVLNLMKNSGFTEVYCILGGLEEWKKQKLPTQTN